MKKIELSKYDYAVGYEIFLAKEYKLLDEIIKSSNVIFDIWWHIWLFSLYAIMIKYGFTVELKDKNIFIENTKTNNDLEIHYFEPIKNSFLIACEMLKNFWVKMNNFWILPQELSKEMFISNKSSQNSLYSSFLNKNDITIQKTFFKPLKDYIFLQNIEKIDLLKMDVEGSEFEILLDLDIEILKKIKTLFLEYHLLNTEFEFLFLEVVSKLKTCYKNVEIIDSKYTTKIGYLFCYD